MFLALCVLLFVLPTTTLSASAFLLPGHTKNVLADIRDNVVNARDGSPSYGIYADGDVKSTGTGELVSHCPKRIEVEKTEDFYRSLLKQ